MPGLPNCYHDVYGGDKNNVNLNSIRLLQCVCSSACFVYTIFLLNNQFIHAIEHIPYGYHFLLLTTTSLCCINPFLDMIGAIYGRHFNRGLWLLNATVSCVLNGLCVYIIMETDLTDLEEVLTGVALFCLLGGLFFFDIFFLLFSLLAKRKRNAVADKRFEEPANTTNQ